MSLSKTINPSLVLVQPRKTRPFLTEILLIGHKEPNQTYKQRAKYMIYCMINKYANLFVNSKVPHF